jgi:uncharacterized protein YuzE
MMKRIYLAVLWIAVQTTMLTAAPPQYELIDIGLTNYDSSQTTQINNKGQICGVLVRDTVTNVFIWDPLLNLRYTHIRANSKPVLNNRTEIFGTQELRIGSPEGGYDQDSIYKWNQPLGYFSPFNIKNLGFPASQKSSPLEEKRTTVWGVNNMRQVVVMNHTAINLPNGSVPEGGFRVWIYHRGNFERIDNARFLMGLKINSKSQVLGCFFENKPGSNDKRYMTSIYNLKTGTTRVLRFPAENLGVDINDKGEIAGTYYNPTANIVQGFLGDPAEDCDIIDDFSPKAVNNRRQMVGSFLYGANKNKPAIWLKHHLYALSDVTSKIDNHGQEWESLDSLIDINDNGDIIGEGRINGAKHGFLLRKIILAVGCSDDDSDNEVELPEIL